ncbi:MAG: F0F1 ATP synthase subunit delta [Gammaproteobacteria bacterium]|nr:F0F1 ATP synthase subunit delta [Gammaproteobacteria bacterium]
MSDISTTARPYARAVFESARGKSSQPKWSEALALMTLVANDPTMNDVLDNPKMTKEQKGDLFASVCGDKIDESGKNLIMLLAENERLSVLPAIAEQYETLRSKDEGIVDAEVTSAMPLTDEQESALKESLKKKLGSDVSLTSKVDESLIGGVVIRAGDMVIDGSIQSQLASLSNALNR